MAHWALVGSVVWFATMLVLRDLIHRHRTGSSGFVPPSSGLGWRASIPGLLFLASFVLVPLAPVLELCDVLRPLWDTTARGARIAAAVLFLVGWLGAFGSQLAMGDSWRIGLDQVCHTDLVTGGPYAIVRNPIYSFVIVSAAALVATVPNAASIAALVLIAVGFDLWVRWIEEPFLIARHGDTFLRYASHTGRFVPRLGLLSAR